MALAIDRAAHGIDAEFRDLEIGERHIGSGIAKLAAALVAMLDRADDLPRPAEDAIGLGDVAGFQQAADAGRGIDIAILLGRSEEHKSELKSLMLISYAVFCLQKK